MQIFDGVQLASGLFFKVENCALESLDLDREFNNCVIALFIGIVLAAGAGQTFHRDKFGFPLSVGLLGVRVL